MAAFIPLSDADAAQLDPYRALHGSDAATRRRGGFIVEGPVALARALSASRYPLSSVLLSERRVERMRELLRAVPDTLPVYVLEQETLDRVCGFPLHRGVLAFGAAPPSPAAKPMLEALEPCATLVVLIGVNDAENVGSIFRNAAAFGAAALVLDADCCDPLFRRVIRVSVGAALSTPFARLAPGEDALALLQAHGFAALAFTPAGAMELGDIRPAARTALVFGAEGPGLPPPLLARCATVRIPMAQGFDSLNVATASGVALHHISSARRGPARP